MSKKLQKNIFFKNHFSNPFFCAILHVFGALAQLGARHTGSVEATGSSPVCSSWENPRIYADVLVNARVFVVQKCQRQGQNYTQKYHAISHGSHTKITRMTISKMIHKARANSSGFLLLMVRFSIAYRVSPGYCSAPSWSGLYHGIICHSDPVWSPAAPPGGKNRFSASCNWNPHML